MKEIHKKYGKFQRNGTIAKVVGNIYGRYEIPRDALAPKERGDYTETEEKTGEIRRKPAGIQMILNA